MTSFAPASVADMRNRYENAVDVKDSASGHALLGLFGFSADAASASS